MQNRPMKSATALTSLPWQKEIECQAATLGPWSSKRRSLRQTSLNSWKAFDGSSQKPSNHRSKYHPPSPQNSIIWPCCLHSAPPPFWASALRYSSVKPLTRPGPDLLLFYAFDLTIRKYHLPLPSSALLIFDQQNSIPLALDNLTYYLPFPPPFILSYISRKGLPITTLAIEKRSIKRNINANIDTLLLGFGSAKGRNHNTVATGSSSETPLFLFCEPEGTSSLGHHSIRTGKKPMEE